MSSSYDAGYYASEQIRIEKTPCPKAKDKKHNFKVYGSHPSTWQECKHCGVTTYSK